MSNFKTEYFDEDTEKEMVRVMAIEKELIPDDNRKIDNLGKYAKDMGYDF